MKNKPISPFKKFVWTISTIAIVSTFIGLIITRLLLEVLSVFWSFEIGMIIACSLAGIASRFYIYMYDTATLDLKTGNFKASADFSDAKEPFILITTVNPLDKPKEEEE